MLVLVYFIEMVPKGCLCLMSLNIWIISQPPFTLTPWLLGNHRIIISFPAWFRLQARYASFTNGRVPHYIPARVPFLNWQIFNFATVSLINVTLPLRNRSTLIHFTCKIGFLIQVTRFFYHRIFPQVIQLNEAASRKASETLGSIHLISFSVWMLQISDCHLPLLNTVICVTAWHPLPILLWVCKTAVAAPIL